MLKIIAEKLKIGDEIRVIAPALSRQILSKQNIAQAVKNLESIGF
jgi:muramoyltetrapeptide carboxypeptidase